MRRVSIVAADLPAWMALLVLCVGSCARATADEWTRFRGEQGAGIAQADRLPVVLTPADRLWGVELPGVGHSSPVIRDGLVFVTSAEETSGARRLFALDARDGRRVWDRSLSPGTDHLHAKNSFTSATPVVGPQRVYVTFADDDRYTVAAFSHAGEPAWSRDLGPFESQHGHGASPILYGDLLIVPNDQDGPSGISALNSETGKTVWDSPRATSKTSYSTPFLLDLPDAPPQLIASCDALGVTSLDPATGRPLWHSGAMPQRTVASPVYAGGLIWQPCGQGGRGVLMVGVDPAPVPAGPRVVIEMTKQLPYVPTPIACGGRLFLWGDNGVVTALDASTRKTLWTERVGGNFSGSPVCVGDRLYAISEDGELVVIRAGGTFEILGRSPLGDPSYATPAVSDGRMYLRTFHRLICVGPASI